jgi:hypothetical protein
MTDKLLDRDCRDPEAGRIAEAIQNCPIVGKFEPNNGPPPDGDPKDSLTYEVKGKSGIIDLYPDQVILGIDFFKRTNTCSQFSTLLKECYIRKVLRDFDDTGTSDPGLFIASCVVRKRVLAVV